MSGKVNEARTFARNAKGVREVLNMKFDTLPFEGDWFEAFNTPERRGVWFIWGNTGNGKTSFVMQLCKYLCRFGRVAYDSLLIFISHATGRLPTGRSAKSVMFDASLKIYVEGYRAFSKGRFIGPRGHFDIWSEKSRLYWGEEI